MSEGRKFSEEIAGMDPETRSKEEAAHMVRTALRGNIADTEAVMPPKNPDRIITPRDRS